MNLMASYDFLTLQVIPMPDLHPQISVRYVACLYAGLHVTL